MVENVNVEAVAREQLQKATTNRAGRAATTVHGGRDTMLRQTVVALTAGASLAEHESPGEATLYVLEGRVKLASATDSSEGGPGELLVVPQERHSLEALSDAAVVLTVAVRP